MGTVLDDLASVDRRSWFSKTSSPKKHDSRGTALVSCLILDSHVTKIDATIGYMSYTWSEARSV